MPLNKLKNTWSYYKRQSDLLPLEATDILEIIQASSHTYQAKTKLNYFNIVMLVLLILICQGG